VIRLRSLPVRIVVASIALAVPSPPPGAAAETPTAHTAPAAAPVAPSRRDLGDLIVLEVAGSYEEMGRQQAELLGDDLRRVFEEQRREYARAVARGGVSARLLDALGVPLWSAVGGAFEDSHFHEEIAGMAAGLGVSRAEFMRALLALGGGSTVFAATRSATADGQALIGRNVDWDDALGRRRPVVVHVHPTNGDLEHLFVGWPLVGLPTIGLNAAGFALSFNYFVTDPQVGVWLPQWPHRRALQVARSVEEGIRLFTSARERGISSFTVMADAAGDIAMVECTPARCAVFRPDGDWFGQSNHARTPEMIPFDRYRSPDSFDRRAGVERAVAARLGHLDPAEAVEILRDRATHPWPNASNVANLAVLNAVVVHPASRTLWHSRTMQPEAPFGAYAGFTLAPGAAPPPALPASPALGSPAMTRERDAVQRAREALHALADGRDAEARDRLDALLGEEPPVLDPTRLAVGAALARLRLGDPAGAIDALGPALADGAPADVAIEAASLRALAADRLGRRDEAVAFHRDTLARIAAHPEWNVFGPQAALAREGLAHSVADREPVTSLYVLRVPQ
jgi:hypothetical protein